MSNTAVNPIYYDELEDDFVFESPAQSRRARRLSACLLATVFAVAAFWGGAIVQKHWGTNATASGFPAAAGNRAGGFNSGTGGAGAATTATTTAPTKGTVASVSGNTVTITDSAGKSVVVKLDSSSTISKSEPATLDDLVAGTSITVSGTKDSTGAITADSITAQAADPTQG